MRCVVDFETFSRVFCTCIYRHRFLDTSVMYTTVRHSDKGDYAFSGCMKPK